MLIHSIIEAIGNTPLLQIDSKVHQIANVELYCKLEMLNPFGSIKDRVGWALLKDSIETLQNEKRGLIEISSGNTAKALAAIGGIYGLKLKTLTNRVKVPEVRDILLLLGAEIEELPGSSECPDPSDPNNPIVYLERVLASSEGKLFNTKQYTSEQNPEAHMHGTAVEIDADIGVPDFLFAGLGTAGSSRGVGKYFHEKSKFFKCFGVVSRSDDFLPGIRRRDEMFEVGIFHPTDYDDVQDVGSDEALEAMLELNRKCGVLAGPSTGGSYAAIKNYFKRVGAPSPKTKVVFFACDRVEWYLTYIRKRRPDLFQQVDRLASTYIPTREELEERKGVSSEELTSLLASKTVLIIDTRHPTAFQAARIPGSINFLDAHLEETLRSTNPFPADKKVVLVCRVGVLTRKLAALARRYGADVDSLVGGLTTWHRSGGAMERGSVCLRSPV